MTKDVAPPPRRAPPCEPTALAQDPGIDRRTCHRTVPMKVICVGLSRTGTCSTRQALLDLGYSDVYHFAAIFNENPRDAEMWNQALLAKYEGKGPPFEKADWDQLLGHCMAVTDTPCAVFWRELLQCYPDAKVILTLRDTPEQWHKSAKATMMHIFDNTYPAHPTLTQCFLKTFGPPPTAVDTLNELLQKHYMYKDLHEHGIEFYNNHKEEVLRTVPKENLLVMNVKEGWGPLCRFLGKEEPGWAFPRVNDSVQFRRNWNVIEGWMWKAAWVNAGRTGGVGGGWGGGRLVRDYVFEGVGDCGGGGVRGLGNGEG